MERYEPISNTVLISYMYILNPRTLSVLNMLNMICFELRSVI